MYWRRTSKKALTRTEGGAVTVDFLRLKAREDFCGADGKTMDRTLAGFEKTRERPPGSDAGLRSVSVKIVPSFHPAELPQKSLLTNYTPTPFDEESPETTVASIMPTYYYYHYYYYYYHYHYYYFKVAYLCVKSPISSVILLTFSSCTCVTFHLVYVF